MIKEALINIERNNEILELFLKEIKPIMNIELC